MLIVFPLALFPTSILFDLIYLMTGSTLWAMISYWLIPIGVIGGLAAALFGYLDWRTIPRGTRARRVGAVHGIGNVIVVLFFTMSWFMRAAPPEAPVPTGAVVLSLLGLGLALVTGWMGGELVDQLGIGVTPGAHADAPSSLSNRPVTRPNIPGRPGFHERRIALRERRLAG
jgi:uncharacterized membrane protein